MDYNYEIIFAVVSVLDTYSIYRLFNVFLGEFVLDKIKLFMTYVFFYFMTTIMHFVINIPFSMLICNIIGLFLIASNYHYSIRKKILSVIFICLILIGVETSVVLVSGYQKLSLFEQGGYGSVVGIVFIKLITYIVALILDKFKGVRTGMEVPISYWFCIFFVPSSSIFIMLQTLNFKMLTYNMLTVEMILFLIINFSVFNLYDRLATKVKEGAEHQLQLQEQRNYIKQFELMKASVDSMRGLKHDLKNHLMTMQVLLKQENHNELTKYIEGMIQRADFQKQYVNTKNIILDSILNFKIFEAESVGIEFNSDIIFPSDLELDPYDLTVILGNLIDNAVEANESRNIHLYIRYIKGCMLIKISNNFSGTAILDKEQGLVTTKNDPQNHGIGLKNVERVVEKYEGIIDIIIEEKMFSSYVMLYIS